MTSSWSSPPALAAAAAPWVFVLPADDDDRERCARLSLPCAEQAAAWQWSVQRTADFELELRAPAAEEPLAIRLELDRGPLARRLRTARRDQPLARAIGRHRRASPPRVFDATAGLGRDALLLAHLGCSVFAVERLPPLAVLVDDAVRRLAAVDCTIVCADATAVLAADSASPSDVVYLDPMFPVQGSAQVKKEMQVCRRLAGAPESPDLLFARAQAHAAERVVVKRHPHELPLAGTPSFTVDGERVRFDVYLRPGAPRS